jgi:hypothetical protein
MMSTNVSTKMSTKSTRRAILAGLVAAPAVPLPALAMSPAPDPIFAAIAAHARATAAYEAAIAVAAKLPPGPTTDAAQDVADRASDALDTVSMALVEVYPTSTAGLIALLSYAADCTRGEAGQWKFPDWVEGGADDYSPFAYFILRSAAEALARMT